METKSCNLTKEEVQTLMSIHGGNLIDYTACPPQIKDETVERIKYLNSRLKTFEDKGVQATEAVTETTEEKKGW